MVGEDDARTAVFPRAYAEKIVPRGFRAVGLHRLVGFLHQRGDIRRPDLACEPERLPPAAARISHPPSMPAPAAGGRGGRPPDCGTPPPPADAAAPRNPPHLTRRRASASGGKRVANQGIFSASVTPRAWALRGDPAIPIPGIHAWQRVGFPQNFVHADSFIFKRPFRPFRKNRRHHRWHRRTLRHDGCRPCPRRRRGRARRPHPGKGGKTPRRSRILRRKRLLRPGGRDLARLAAPLARHRARALRPGGHPHQRRGNQLPHPVSRNPRGRIPAHHRHQSLRGFPRLPGLRPVFRR